MPKFVESIKNSKTVSLLSLSSLFLNISNLISGFLVYKWLSPYYVGIWNAVILLTVYSTFLRMGVINGMNREYPFFMGKGDEKTAYKIVETTLGYTLIDILLYIILFVAYALFCKIDQEYYISLVVVSVIVCINFYHTYLLATFRSDLNFDKLSIIQFIQGILKLFTVILVFYFGYDGLLLREIIISMILVIITHYWRPIKVKPNLDFNILKNIVKTGLPIFGGSYLISFINTFPQIILLKYGTFIDLGIYAPILTILTTLSILPDTLGIYFYPKMSFWLGSGINKKELFKKSLFVHIVILLFGIPLFFIGKLILPSLVLNYLPKYSRIIDFIDVTFLTGIFLGFKFGYTTLVTLKAWYYTIFYTISFGVLLYFWPLYFLKYHSPLNSVIYGQLVAFAIMFIISIGTNYLATRENVKV